MYETQAGRTPVSVTRLRGLGAYGCDVLSFERPEDLQIFETDPTRIDLVSRFIEVKSGGVRLNEGELVGAERARERYFVYRLHFVDEARNRANLTMICDPLRYPAAMTRVCEIRLEEIAGRKTTTLSAVRSTTKG